MPGSPTCDCPGLCPSFPGRGGRRRTHRLRLKSARGSVRRSPGSTTMSLFRKATYRPRETSSPRFSPKMYVFWERLTSRMSCRACSSCRLPSVEALSTTTISSSLPAAAIRLSMHGPTTSATLPIQHNSVKLARGTHFDDQRSTTARNRILRRRSGGHVACGALSLRCGARRMVPCSSHVSRRRHALRTSTTT